jgi:hypothetical protein
MVEQMDVASIYQQAMRFELKLAEPLEAKKQRIIKPIYSSHVTSTFQALKDGWSEVSRISLRPPT